MNLFKSFEKNLTDQFQLNPSGEIIVAVSGGIDSMVLLHLFQQTMYRISVAHCNFGLRGDESEEDNLFVKHYCSANDIQLFEKKFELKKNENANFSGIQETARKLRYDWFEELSVTHSFDFIATAHHLNDVAETLIFNIIRGTGIAGLHGIPAMNGKIIRPLLFATKTEIAEYAEKNNLSFREDSSNEINKYSRNKIRNQVIPVLKEINPLLEEHVHSLTRQIAFIEKIYRNHIDNTWENIHTVSHDQIEISIQGVLSLNSPQFYLFEFLQPFGFNYSQVSEIVHSLNKQAGKHFFSQTHLLLKDRETLIISKLANKTNIEFTIEKGQKISETDNLFIKIAYLNSTDKPEFISGTFYFDIDSLCFPLRLRKWIDGDKFVPFGMNSPKKISDFFIDKKINAIEKQQAWILCSGDEKIIGVLPYRIDDRNKLTSLTKNILEITCINK